jgi:N-acetylmuramic acid 6-phosphate (MurNAc-6-P) etherase
LTGLDAAEAQATLDAAGGDLRLALVMHKTGRPRGEAARALAAAQNIVAQAVTLLTK